MPGEAGLPNFSPLAFQNIGIILIIGGPKFLNIPQFDLRPLWSCDFQPCPPGEQTAHVEPVDPLVRFGHRNRFDNFGYPVRC